MGAGRPTGLGVGIIVKRLEPSQRQVDVVGFRDPQPARWQRRRLQGSQLEETGVLRHLDPPTGPPDIGRSTGVDGGPGAVDADHRFAASAQGPTQLGGGRLRHRHQIQRMRRKGSAPHGETRHLPVLVAHREPPAGKADAGVDSLLDVSGGALGDARHDGAEHGVGRKVVGGDCQERCRVGIELQLHDVTLRDRTG